MNEKQGEEMPVDLHIHTTASDGTDSPERVVEKARAAGLKAIALTDHDTVGGCGRALAEARKWGMEVVAGVELGAFYNGQEVHILGYLVDLNDEAFLSSLETLRQGRLGRMDQMVEMLRRMGFALEMEQVLAISGGGAIGRPHLAAALVKIGAVESNADAFKKLIGKGCPAYVQRYKLEPVEAVQSIRRAGGLAVMAHPGLDNAGSLIAGLVPGGLAGLEAHHPAHTREQVNYYERLAKRENLLVTGGSDYHGYGCKPGCHLGAATVPYSVLTEMKRRRPAPA
jgi:predicted metal-dependent phosphoesterase TrpH